MQQEQDKTKLRGVKSFVLRAGRTSESQKKAISNLMPKFGFDISDKQKIIDFINKKPTVLEIGFGTGDAFICHVKENSQVQFLGIEVHPPGIGHTLKLIEENAIENLKIIQHDAIEILKDIIPDNSLLGLQLFFPDPWPKKKHHKRRIVQSSFLDLVKTKLKANNSYLHIATDWEPYAEHISELLDEQPSLIKLDDTNKDQIPCTPRAQTKFELRGKKLGHKIFDFIFLFKPKGSK